MQEEAGQLRTLVIDTATQALSLALMEGDAIIASVHETVGRGHAEKLLPAIAALPDGGCADAIAVDVGPGSFTGVRIGLAAARALAFGWDVPVHGYSALAMIAAVVRRDTVSAADFVVAINGGHGELFWQRFDTAGGDATTGLASTPIATLAMMVDDPVVYGTGAASLVAARGHGHAVDIDVLATHYSLLGPHRDYLPPSPIYGRGADATTMADRLSAKAIA